MENQPIYKAKIVPLMGRFDSELYIYRVHGGDYYNVNVTEQGLTETKLSTGMIDETIKPFMVASETVLRALLAAMDDLRKPLGVPEPAKEYSQGKLEATERHLEDMRTLLFNKQ